MKAVLIADREHVNYHASEFFTVYSDEVLDRLHTMVDLDPSPVYWQQRDEKIELMRNAELIFSNWGMPVLDADTVAAYFPSVRAVFYAGGDVRHFAIPYFHRGVRIFCTGEANAVPASEYALSQILQANKLVQYAVRTYRDPESYYALRERIDSRSCNFRAMVGILGAGRVGGRLARRLSSFDLEVCVCDPFLQPEQIRAMHARCMDWDELFATCDVISCHLPDHDALYHAIDEAAFSLMQDEAVFINAGQANQVDQDALIRHFAAHPRQTAILDSTSPMPLPEGHPLFTMNNVFLTPHIAGSFGGELERMGEEVITALEDYLNGRPSEHEVFRGRLPE